MTYEATSEDIWILASCFRKATPWTDYDTGIQSTYFDLEQEWPRLKGRGRNRPSPEQLIDAIRRHFGFTCADLQLEPDADAGAVWVTARNDAIETMRQWVKSEGRLTNSGSILIGAWDRT